MYPPSFDQFTWTSDAASALILDIDGELTNYVKFIIFVSTFSCQR